MRPIVKNTYHHGSVFFVVRGQPGVLFVVVAAPDLVVVLDVDKILAFQARNLERF